MENAIIVLLLIVFILLMSLSISCMIVGLALLVKASVDYLWFNETSKSGLVGILIIVIGIIVAIITAFSGDTILTSWIKGSFY